MQMSMPVGCNVTPLYFELPREKPLLFRLICVTSSGSVSCCSHSHSAMYLERGDTKQGSDLVPNTWHVGCPMIFIDLVLMNLSATGKHLSGVCVAEIQRPEMEKESWQAFMH